VRPRRSQVPSPMIGIRAPWASTTGTMSAVTMSAVPRRRVRRIDDAAVRPLERSDRGHLGIAQGKVEDRQILGEVLRIGGARNRDDPLLNEIAQRNLRRALAVRLA